MPIARTVRFAAVSFAALATLLVTALVTTGCGSTSSGGGLGGESGSSAPVGDLANAKRATGNVQVTLQLLPPNRQALTIALVNESSEIGQKLTTGKATSTTIRVIDDLAMGRLLVEMDAQGFSANSTPGLSLKNLRDYPGRRGVVVVEQSGDTRGLDFGTGLGAGPVPKTFVECKRVIMALHGAAAGLEVRTMSNEDADRLFQGGKAEFPRR